LSGGAPELVSGLGLLRGSLSVHLDSEPQRLPVFCHAVGAGELPPGYAADDGAGLVFAGTSLLECVGSRPGARAVEIRPGEAGVVRQRQLPVRLLRGADDGQLGGVEGHGVGELRELRAGLQRWK
jgi:dipeptidase E